MTCTVYHHKNFWNCHLCWNWKSSFIWLCWEFYEDIQYCFSYSHFLVGLSSIPYNVAVVFSDNKCDGCWEAICNKQVQFILLQLTRQWNHLRGVEGEPAERKETKSSRCFIYILNLLLFFIILLFYDAAQSWQTPHKILQLDFCQQQQFAFCMYFYPA